MASWDMGYNSDHQYTFGYFHEMTPLFIQYMLALQGYDFPQINDDFCACELGIGQGITLNMMSATNKGKYYGTDFNSEQINYARKFAEKGNIVNVLEDAAFHEFAALDLPKFDYIALHGIWSWISPENQNIIVDFLANNLKVGGVVYISYNTKPGFSIMEPVRYLMKKITTDEMIKNASAAERQKDLAQFFTEIFKINPLTAQQIPNMVTRTNSVFNQDPNYIDSEYLNEYWDLLHFEEMVKILDKAKLNYAGVAYPFNLVDELHITKEQANFLQPYKGSLFYETLKDFIFCTQFRRDLFIRGPRKLSLNQQKEKLAKLPLVMVVSIKDILYKGIATFGEYELDEKKYKPLLELMSDNIPRTALQIAQALPQIDEDEIYQMIAHALNFFWLLPANSLDSISNETINNCQKLNEEIINGNLTQESFLASPVLGGALFCNELLFKLLKLYTKLDYLTEQDRRQDMKNFFNQFSPNQEKNLFIDCLANNSLYRYTHSAKEKDFQQQQDFLQKNLQDAQNSSDIEKKALIPKLEQALSDFQNLKNMGHLGGKCLNYDELVDHFIDNYLPILRALKIIK